MTDAQGLDSPQSPEKDQAPQDHLCGCRLTQETQPSVLPVLILTVTQDRIKKQESVYPEFHSTDLQDDAQQITPP